MYVYMRTAAAKQGRWGNTGTGCENNSYITRKIQIALTDRLEWDELFRDFRNDNEREATLSW